VLSTLISDFYKQKKPPTRLFVDGFLHVMKGTTDKLVPASMIQNKTIFELYRDVVDTMVSNTGGFAAILH
jgi:hypothetical protein